jgi:two-component system copper resistance phosphate regulon response regulator CusR
MRLLLVEDDPGLSETLREGLKEQGFVVRVEGSYSSGLDCALRGEYEAIILDVMLPGGSGFDLCRALREASVNTPVLMLTARDSVDDRVIGLESGADDYLPKPFAFKELIARLRAIMRRTATRDDVLHIADLEVDLGAHRARRNGRDIPLTAKEFLLLEFLARHKDRVVTRAAISAHVWDENHDPFTNVLEVLVRRLRRKIDDGFSPKLIHTLRGAGYRLGT